MSVKITTTVKVPQHLQELINLYMLYSDWDCTYENLKLPLSIHLKLMTEVYQIGSKKSLEYNFINYNIEDISYPNNKDIIICCSGGKDSTAVALKLKEEGHNIILYYVKGINKAYPDEEKRIDKIANYLQVPYYIEDRFKFTGHSDFPDNPIKNQLILSMAANYAYEINIGCNIAFGDFKDDTVEKCNIMTSWSDTVEMNQAYLQFIKHYIPAFNYIAPFKYEFDSINILYKYYHILPLTQSCIMPQRFRNSLKQHNEEKYQINLPDNRCGSCYKCCREYIQFYLLGLYEFNEGYYNHCLDIFKSSLKKQHPEFKLINDKIAYEYYVKLPYQEVDMNEFIYG